MKDALQIILILVILVAGVIYIEGLLFIGIQNSYGNLINTVRNK